MPCPLKLSNCSSQKDIYSCPGSDIERYWHQNCRVLNKAYIFLVIRRITGPMTMDIDIIFPVILIRDLASICVFLEATCNCSFQ